jgi:hypothetical protein
MLSHSLDSFLLEAFQSVSAGFDSIGLSLEPHIGELLNQRDSRPVIQEHHDVSVLDLDLFSSILEPAFLDDGLDDKVAIG